MNLERLRYKNNFLTRLCYSRDLYVRKKNMHSGLTSFSGFLGTFNDFSQVIFFSFERKQSAIFVRYYLHFFLTVDVTVRQNVRKLSDRFCFGNFVFLLEKNMFLSRKWFDFFIYEPEHESLRFLSCVVQLHTTCNSINVNLILWIATAR